MKAKKILLLIFVSIGLTTLMSTTCEKDDPDNPLSCDGYITATSSGNINTDLCFDIYINYELDNTDQKLVFNARQEGDPEYGFGIYVYGYTGPGTYNCGTDEPAFLELILHGSENEFYKSQSGSITVTEAGDSGMKANFNIVTKGYYNDQTVNISGTVNFAGVVK